MRREEEAKLHAALTLHSAFFRRPVLRATSRRDGTGAAAPQLDAPGRVWRGLCTLLGVPEALFDAHAAEGGLRRWSEGQ